MESFTDKAGQKRDGIRRNCKECGASFLTRKDQPLQHCSRLCQGRGSRKRLPLTCSGCGTTFEKTASQIKASKSGHHFCSRQCKDQSQRIGGIAAIMPLHYGTGPVDYRALFEKEELVCARCGYCEFDCGVDIHHIDKNRENNKLENLIPLCKCCHIGLHNNRWKLEGLRV